MADNNNNAGVQSSSLSRSGAVSVASEKGAKSWDLIEVQMAKCSHVLQIANFSSCREENGESITSSTFAPDVSLTQDSKLKFQIHVYPKGESEASKGFISIMLQLVESDKGKVSVRPTFTLLKRAENGDYTRSFRETLLFDDGKTWGFPNFVSRLSLFNNADRFLKDDRLTIHCEVGVVIGNTLSVSSHPTPHSIRIPEDTLLNDFGRLISQSSFSDTILLCSGRKFPAHRNILAARSPVFRAMFDKDAGWLESSQTGSSEVDLGSNMNPEVVEAMLEFIYTGQCSNLGQLAQDLLAAADKYQLDRLKALCEQSLADNLTIDSAADTLVFADLHSANQLRAATLAFINGHAKEFAESSGFKQMLTSNPTLAVEIYRSLVAGQSPPSISEPPRRS